MTVFEPYPDFEEAEEEGIGTSIKPHYWLMNKNLLLPRDQLANWVENSSESPSDESFVYLLQALTHPGDMSARNVDSPRKKYFVRKVSRSLAGDYLMVSRHPYLDPPDDVNPSSTQDSNDASKKVKAIFGVLLLVCIAGAIAALVAMLIVGGTGPSFALGGFGALAWLILSVGNATLEIN